VNIAKAPALEDAESRRLSVASLNKNDRRSDSTCCGRRRIVS
jgi:hypothetical protein